MFGKIKSIEANYVVVENTSEKLEVNYLNYHVVFPEKNRGVVGEIVGIDENEIKIFLVGEIRNGVFTSGVLKKPHFSSVPRLVYKNEAELFLGCQEGKKCVYIGKSNTYEGFNICADLNAFFANHFAIIGNTGSGKSCGVARILQNLYGNKETMPVNSHIVLFDVYGEYKHALSHLNDMDGMGYKNLTSKLDLSDGEIINIPAYFLEVDDLALLLHVTNSSSLPILEKAIKLVYIFKSQDEKMISYKNDIIASCLLDILSSGRNSTQIRDQVLAILSRYNTEALNADTEIYQPGYSRTIRQCLNIDNQGKMNAVQSVVDFLEKYQKLDLSSLEVSKDIAYSLDDLYYALEFALISEGVLKSDKAYDEYNELKVRLQQIINSENKKFFEVGETRITKDTYIRNLFNNHQGRFQIINMNLNYIDERFAKTLTKIFAKMFFDFATELEERASYPIHIILEEAHRYVVADNDKFLLGYNIFERIAKEGRKYGVLIDLISQRPVDISETVVAQMSNFLVLKMTHPKDLEYIEKMLPNVSSDIIEKLNSLQSGTLVSFGNAFKIPLLIKMDLPNPLPYSSNCDVIARWKGNN